MKKLQMLKGLAGVALLAASASASASPCIGICDVYLRVDQNHSESQGNLKNFFWAGEGVQGYRLTPTNTGPAFGTIPSNATFTWNTATGVLTQTGGDLWAGTYTGNNAVTGTSIWQDHVTGLQIDTVNKTTTAATYECREGNFNVSNSSNGCGGYGLVDTTDSSIRTYNIGSADCMSRTIGGNDVAAAGSVMRGLRERGAGGGCEATAGALDMVDVISDNMATGGLLILAGVNSKYGTTGGLAAGCLPNAGGTGVVTNTACGDAHWLTFVPVPGAVWLFGSALGLLGLRRRFTA